MLLNEIITINDKGTDAILIEKLIPYKKSLLTYYRDFFNCEPILMVTSVFNAAQYGIIVPCDEIEDAFYIYMGSEIENNCEAEEKETIMFNSILLSNL